MSIATITPQRLHEAFTAGRPVELIDVRTPAEFAGVHIGFAQNVPLDRLDPAQLATKAGPTEPLYVVCRSGNRSKQACERLLAAGPRPVVNVEGGTTAWEAAGYPVVRGQAVMSLERQVRIAAGLLVVAGTALGALVHPYWLALPGFVGAGLTFAGLTDTCGMGMLLAKMPWNQAPRSTSNAESANSGGTPKCCS